MGKRHDQKVAHDTFGLNRIGQRAFVVNAVMVAPTFPHTGEGADFLEIGNDVLHRPFRDPDMGRALPQPQVRIFMKEHQDMRVVGQECPCRMGALGLLFLLHGGKEDREDGIVNRKHELDFVN